MQLWANDRSELQEPGKFKPNSGSECTACSRIASRGNATFKSRGLRRGVKKCGSGDSLLMQRLQLSFGSADVLLCCSIALHVDTLHALITSNRVCSKENSRL